MTLPLVLALQATLAGGNAPGLAECDASTSAPRLDHVIVAVRDLEDASARASRLGFKLKRGRLHANQLLNRHIKFRDTTEIELMTVVGSPGDRMAREYQALIDDGDGGAYVALRVSRLDDVEVAATRVGLLSRRSRSGPWQFLSFPPESRAGAVFFVSGGFPPVDPESVLAHDDGSIGLRSAWVEGGAELGALLEAVGGRTCDHGGGSTADPGTRIGLGAGSLRIVPGSSTTGSLRVLGAVLATSDPSRRRGPRVQLLPTFWIGYE